MEHKPIELGQHVQVINLGLTGFCDSIRSQQTPCVHVDWCPPAGGDVKLIEILDRLKAHG